MARHLRVEYPGAIYHVTCRMIGDHRPDRSRLFVDDSDRERFLVSLADRVGQYNVRLYLFVLMTNHFHLAFETPDGNCSKFMQSLSTAYTVYYNLRHGRHGHLLDGRFKAKLVEGDSYLLALSRYVHLNPVRVGMVKNKPLAERIKALRLYPWSSYQGYIGSRKALEFVEYGPLLSEMNGRKRDWPKRYREFVEAGLAESDPSSRDGYDVTSDDFRDVLKMSPRSIGGEQFRAWVDELHQGLAGKTKSSEDVAFRRIAVPLATEKVLCVVAEVFGVDIEEFRVRRRNSVLRGIAGRLLVRYSGLTQREVAKVLGLRTGASVSIQMRRAGEVIAEEESITRRVNKATKLLAAFTEPERLKKNAKA